MPSLTIGFIGLGLIGGSLAKSIKRVYPSYTLLAYNRNEAPLIQAVEEGVISRYSLSIDSTFTTCDYIFLCTPVETNADILPKLKSFIKPSCILSDVGSVKTNIHESIAAAKLEASFIGGHPMSGSEKTGYKNATDHLLENAYYALTPTSHTPKESLEAMEALIKAIGALPIVLDYAHHDYVVAAVSHLPHLIASSLVNLVKDSDSEKETMKTIAAGGFKDITRIASSSPEMWQQICMTNNKNIALLLGKYIDSLEHIKHSIEHKEEDEVFDLFHSGKEYRSSFTDISPGPIKKQYAIYCDVADEAGAISTVAALLAGNSISIKNIGIVNNREFEDEVLHIQFYTEESAAKAVEILSDSDYTVYKR